MLAGRVPTCDPDVVDGEHDLEKLISTLDVERRLGVYTFVTGEWQQLATEAHAMVLEAEGHSYVVEVDDAHRAGAPVGFQAAWLTVRAHSALGGVGLTAVISRVLADAGIACNVIAGYHHDHLLVPLDRAGEAAELLRALSSR
jgi:hypothetical protein